MQSFVSFSIPLWLRGRVVMAPSFVVVAAGMDITHALVLSQVVLSLVLPIPMVALVRSTVRRYVMGDFVNTRLTNALAIAATGFVCLLNGLLLLPIAAQMIPTSQAGRTVSLPDPIEWRLEPPHLQVTASHNPYSLPLAALSGLSSSLGGIRREPPTKLMSIALYGNFKTALAVCVAKGFSRLKECSNGPDEAAIRQRRSDRRDPARRRDIGRADHSAGYPDHMSADSRNRRNADYSTALPVS